MKIIRPFTPTDTGSFTRASTATYFDSAGVLQTAAVDTPRFTYDPGTLAYQGLMIEAASTNLLPRSQEFDNAVWVKSLAAVAANSTAGLDGTLSADTITVTGAVDPYVSQDLPAQTVTYCSSVFAKKNVGSVMTIRAVHVGLGTPTSELYFNFDTKTWTSSGSQFVSAGYQDAGSGWVRIWLVWNQNAAATASGIRFYPTNFLAGAVGDSCYLWGAQTEVGTAPSSYIPTTTTAVTRAADVNTLSMLSNVPQADAPVWDASKVYAIGDTVMVTGTSEHEVYESLTGARSAVTISNATPAVVGWTAHGLAALTPVSFTTTGTLPTGLTVGTVYYVLDTGLTANSFELCATPTLGGAAIATSSAGSGVHTATGSTNFNKTPSLSPTAWLDTGSTNRWRMFDSSVQSQTTNPDVIDVYVELTSRIDSVALINIDALSVHITLTDPVDGVVYDNTIDTTLTSGIVDWYTYFFEPVERVVDMAVIDLPPYASGTLRVQINAPASSVVECGGCVIGQSLDIGDTEVGVKVGTQDYSIKTRDAFGNFTIVQRAFNKRANFTLTVDSSTVDKLQIMFATYRASPLVWLGSLSYGATLIYGFYKSFEIEIGYLDGTSVVTLEVEGLI